MNGSWLARIPWNEFTFETSRSRGPGGQNVNRTNSAVTLRWTPGLSAALSEEQKAKIASRLQNRMTTTGEILIRSEVHRDQDQNKKDCLQKLEALLTRAFFEPKPRKATKPTRSSQRRRIEGKRQRSETKQGRQKVRA